MIKNNQVLCVLNKKVDRLDQFLVLQLQTKRSLIQTLIKDGYVHVNKETVNKTGYSLKKKDLVEVFVEDYLKKKDQQQFQTLNSDLQITFSILYEDEFLMVIYKPKGLLTHQTSFNEKNTLYHQLLKYQIEHHLNNLDDLRAGLIHRLDKYTSGLMLVAKSRSVFYQLRQNLENQEIHKFYFALVEKPFSEQQEFLINLPIGHSKTSIKMQIKANGKKALTKVKVCDNFLNYALVECELLTGRTHQIRVHLSSINHPIYDDPMYGKKIDDFGQYLSAHKLTFIHPITKQALKFDIGLEPYLKKKIEDIKQHE